MSKVFFCVSAYEGNFDLLKYADDYFVYVKEGGSLENLPEKFEKIPNYGYNIYSYLKFIVDNYDSLPERIFFLKNNIYPRHLSEHEFIDQIRSGQDHFFSRRQIKQSEKAFLRNNYFYEVNNSWYLRSNKPKYFGSAEAFYRHFFLDPLILSHIKFCPGGNVMKTREQIKSRPVAFYYSLLRSVEYKTNAPESYLLERFLDDIFNPSTKISDHFEDSFPLVPKSRLRWFVLSNFARFRDRFSAIALKMRHRKNV